MTVEHGVREDAVTAPVNGWIGQLFHPDNLDDTVAALMGAQSGAHEAPRTSNAKARKAEAERRLRKLQEAIAVGVDPAALVEPINQAQTDRVAAQVEMDNQPATGDLDRAEVYAMIDSLGDVGTTLADAKPAGLARLYRNLDLNMVYQPEEQAIDVTACPGVDSACVRGGT
ncbi:hypothetical protein [Actinokineospora spheciospongiae]|uniref:hypothetical protein n=1 Tax=Actinokineospora spheciospongiae TaxID=909613 RepID=UPI000D709179|nr:hypothetical protein [Actinokineospora spheciospongiae]